MNVTIYPGRPSGVNFDAASVVKNIAGATVQFCDTEDPFISEGSIAVGASQTLTGTYFFATPATALLSYTPLGPTTDAQLATLGERIGEEETAREDADTALDARAADLEAGQAVLSAALSTQVGRTAYNAKNYSLVGDGTTSDDAAMAAMLAVIPTGARLHFPRGEYKLGAGSLPPSKLEIAGDGQGATTFKVASGATLAAGLLQWTNASDVIVRDLTIDLNKANTPDGGADGAQMGLYFYTGAAGASRRNRVERVRVLNGERHGIVVGAAASALPTEVDLIDVDVEDCDSIGAFISYATRCRITRGNYLRNGLDNIQFLRSSGFIVDDVLANGSLAGHGVCAGDMCSDFEFRGGFADSNNQSGWVASVGANRFSMLGNHARLNGQLGLTVDLRNHPTALTAGINNSVTTIPVVSTADHATAGTIRIDTERISYTGITSTSFTGCTRGVEGSAAASHSNAAVVYSEKFHITEGIVAGYVLSANTSHGLYHQYGADLQIGPGVCRGNGIDGALIVAFRTAIDGLNANANVGRGLAFENDAGGSPTGDHRVSGGRLFNNGGAAYQDNASDPSIADLSGDGTPESVVKAAKGCTFRRRDGGAATCLYVKETSAAAATGWVAK